MIRSMYNATSGMKASTEKVGVISNNIANSQTVGFKGQRVEFADVFYQQLRSPSAPGSTFPGTNPMDVGNGVMITAMSNNFAQGAVTSSSRKTDVSIQGDGFFVVQGAGGEAERVFTRAGNFDLTLQGELVTKSSMYVMGWMANPVTGEINSGAGLSRITIPFGQLYDPQVSSQMRVEGNLNATAKQGDVTGFQVPTFDHLGVKHIVDLNFTKTGTPGEFIYTAVPTDQFTASPSIKDAVLSMNGGVASALEKGSYTIQTVAGGVPGTVDISLISPSGATVLTQNVSDTDQKVILNDGTNNWFTITYEGGGALPSNATFEVGDVGRLQFDPTGNLLGITDSGGAAYTPTINFTPDQTGMPLNVQLDLSALRSLATQNTVQMTSTDGNGASTLVNFTVGDGGIISGYYDDGTIRDIGQIAVATFKNNSGLTRVGAQGFRTTAASGDPQIGLPNDGGRGQIKSLSLENSNVELTDEFVDLMSTQKFMQANSKTIQISDTILDVTINLIR